MEIQTVIERLNAAKGPERGLDGQIAQVLGWKKVVEPILDPKTGESRNKTLWLVPAGDDFGRIPYFTGSFDAARDLIDLVAPGRAVACTWSPDRCQSAIDGERFVMASTPILALCISALSYRLTNIIPDR